MNDDQTVSVSKGVFIFKNNFKPPSKHSKHRKKVVRSKTTNKNSLFSSNLWYQTYSELWKILEEQIEELNNEMFSSVLSNLVEYIGNSHNIVVEEIPTAALLTGINMPDHGAQFKSLSNQIRKTISPHVACLYSQDCQNLKYLMEHMINQFVNEYISLDDENTEEVKPYLKKNQLNLSVLQCWYENLYGSVSLTSTNRKVLVVILPDFECFNVEVLRKFILITSSYIKVLPFVFVFGIATSITTLHMSLPYQASSKISMKVFHSQPSTAYLNNVLEKVFFTFQNPFLLGGKAFNLLTDIFLFYDLSVSNFIQNIKYAMAEHFSYGNAMALCSLDKSVTEHIINNFTNEDLENVRHLMSFRKLVESESYENRIQLLTNDNYFRKVLNREIIKIQKYIRRLQLFLNCLLILVGDLPKSPLGKQFREIYAVAVSGNITNTQEYKECFQLLAFQSKDELSAKVLKIIDYLSDKMRKDVQSKIKDFSSQLIAYLNDINNFTSGKTEAVSEIENDDMDVTGTMDRKQFKQKLLGMSRQQNRPLNRYEKIRNSVVKTLSETFEEYLLDPKTFNFHEIFFFDDISIQNNIIGSHRSAIHNALNDPQYYLQCDCCEIPNTTTIKSSMPDICIAYKLHLECGKMINLYDWLQAFLSVVDPTDIDDVSKRIVDPELQARFTQAVAELEYLGFIKSSKRKADHVTRLTWGG